MLIHLPIIILTSLHPYRNSISHESARAKAARKQWSKGARPTNYKPATSFRRNGSNLAPAPNFSATKKPALMVAPAMSNS